jgi:hypothetical protein
MCLCLGVLRWIVTSFNRERERKGFGVVIVVGGLG